MLKTEFQDSDESPGFLLWRVNNSWQARQRQALLEFDLTHVQFVLIASLAYAHDAQLTQKQLARFTNIDVMMTSQVLRKLEQKDLITRKRNTEDRREIYISITPLGTALVNKAIRVVEGVDREFFAPLGGQAADFIAMMSQLTGE